MFPLVETIKVKDGTNFNLYYHQKRLNQSYLEIFEDQCPFVLEEIITLPDKFKKGSIKLRFLYNKNRYKLEFYPYVPRKIKTLKLVFNDTIDYSNKYTDRTDLLSLLEQKEDCDEILVVRKGLITDTSFSNIIFFDGKKWITPADPLLKGVCREKLIKEKHVFERKIRLEDLKSFESFALINAMLCGSDLDVIDTENIIAK